MSNYLLTVSVSCSELPESITTRLTLSVVIQEAFQRAIENSVEDDASSMLMSILDMIHIESLDEFGLTQDEIDLVERTCTEDMLPTTYTLSLTDQPVVRDRFWLMINDYFICYVEYYKIYLQGFIASTNNIMLSNFTNNRDEANLVIRLPGTVIDPTRYILCQVFNSLYLGSFHDDEISGLAFVTNTIIGDFWKDHKNTLSFNGEKYY